MRKVFLLLALITTPVLADEIGGGRMMFAAPEPVAPVAPVEKKADATAAPASTAYVTPENYVKPNYARRQIINNPIYKNPRYVKQFYNSMNNYEKFLNAEEEKELEEARQMGLNLAEVQERLKKERVFSFKYAGDPDKVDEDIRANPQKVMLVIMDSIQYAEGDTLTEEAKNKILDDLNKKMLESTGLTIDEHDELDKRERELNTSPVRGENLFISSPLYKDAQ